MEKKHSKVCYIKKRTGEVLWEPIKEAKHVKNGYGLDLFKYDGKIIEGQTGVYLCDVGQLNFIVEKNGIEKISELINRHIEATGLSPRYTKPEETKEDVFGVEEKSDAAHLMKPLFIDGMFNRKGKRIRAKYLKTISHDGAEYSLWISAGKPENDYPRSGNDTYYMMVNAGNYLVPAGYTEFDLEQRAGREYLNREWYGDFNGRQEYFKVLRKSVDGDDSDSLVAAKIAEENEFIEQHGKSDAIQAKYLKRVFIDPSIAQYIEARDNGGNFANFCGAAFLGELERCDEIATVLKAVREQKRIAKQAADQERQEKEVREAEAKAEIIFLEGGRIDDGNMIVKLADKYGISIPPRTRGWILNTLEECTLSGDSASIRYWKRKSGKGSTKIYDILFAIQRAIRESRSLSA